MKKGALGIVWVMIISCIFSSCNSSKSLQELLQEEQKAIDRFINDSSFIVLKNYPADGVFKEKEYYRTTEGLFFHVTDSGNGNRAQLVNDISVRFDYTQLVKNVASGDSSKMYYPYTSTYLSTGAINIASGQPYSFTYGIAATYSGTYSPVCQAWVLPLSYVGEGAVIDMIIPSALGSYNDNMNVTPVFYKNLRYTKFN